MNTATPMFIQSIGLSIDGNTVFENECPDEYVHENRIYDLACHVLEDNTDGEWECVNRYPRPMFAMGICKTYPFRNSQRAAGHSRGEVHSSQQIGNCLVMLVDRKV